MILPHEEKFVLVKCNSKPVCTNSGYRLKLFVLPLTSVPVSDYYVYDLIETSVPITNEDSFKSLVEFQPMIQKIRDNCIGCAMDLARVEILQDGVFSQYRNIHKLAEIYCKSHNEKNAEFFAELRTILEKSITEHFIQMVKSNNLSNIEVHNLNECMELSKEMDFETRMNYLEKLSKQISHKIYLASNKMSNYFVEAEF